MDYPKRLTIALFAGILLIGTQVRLSDAQTNPTGENQAPRVADNRPLNATQAGAPFELTPPQQQRVDQILQFWEQRSNKVRTFTCRFNRWEYDAQFGPPNWQNAPRTISQGVVNYKQPDKGQFKVEHIKHWDAARDVNGRPLPGVDITYVERPGDFGEHWICDGKTIFEFVPQRKNLIERPLPTQMQGRAIVDGPLPFLFGAKSHVLKSRYWIREVQPPNTGEYWLEAFPKLRANAANFQYVTIILDQAEFLPTGLIIHLPDEKSRSTFQFTDRKINLIDPFKWLKGNFYNPKTPDGWQRMVEQVPGG